MRRRLMINGEEVQESVAYSGTLEITERTHEDVFFEAPGATHFAIMMQGEPDYTTGKAFFFSIIANVNKTSSVNSVQAGTSVTVVSFRDTGVPDQTSAYLIFSEQGVTMKVPGTNNESYRRWFQVGTYDWIAW